MDFNSIEDNAGWNLFFPARIIFPNLTAFLNFTPVVFWWPVLTGDPTHPVLRHVPLHQAGARRSGRTTRIFDVEPQLVRRSSPRTSGAPAPS